MQPDQTDDDKRHDDLPEFNPASRLISNNDTDKAADEGATEPGDTHPVFGSDIQPQEILDKERIGTDDDSEPLKGENTVVNYDPEKDSRMQETPEAE